QNLMARSHRKKSQGVSSLAMMYRDSCQELLGDRGAEPVILDNELADELVQATLKDPIHPAVLQPRANAARLPLRWTLPAIGAGDRIEIVHNGLVAGCKRTRHLIPQDQKVGDQPGLQAFAIDPMIGGECGH